MKLKYQVEANPLQKDGSYYARALYGKTLNQDDVIDRMMELHSGVPRESAIATLELLNKVIAMELMAGNKVNLDSVNLALVVKGKFTHWNERFDPNHHKVVLQAAKGRGLGKLLRRFKPEFKAAVRPKGVPVLYDYTDFSSNTKNHLVTPGGMGQLDGLNLKINPADEAQGLWLVGTAGQRERIALLSNNSPKKLIFMLPAELSVGTYTLEVANVYKARCKLQTKQLPHTLTIQ